MAAPNNKPLCMESGHDTEHGHRLRKKRLGGSVVRRWIETSGRNAKRVAVEKTHFEQLRCLMLSMRSEIAFDLSPILVLMRRTAVTYCTSPRCPNSERIRCRNS